MRVKFSFRMVNFPFDAAGEDREANPLDRYREARHIETRIRRT